MTLYPEDTVTELHLPVGLPGDDDGPPSGVGVDGRRVVADDGAARRRPRLLGQVLLRHRGDRALPLLNSQDCRGW